MRVITLALLNVLLIAPASSEDISGQFAIKGIGKLSCREFIEAKDNGESSYLQFGGWIEGFLSASNKHLNQTYDIAPWQTTETIATIAYTACKKNQDAGFAGVINEVSRHLIEGALNERSETIRLSRGKYSVSLPTKVHQNAKKRLKSLGFLQDTTSELEVQDALLRYQISKNLPQTGLPDQYTLWNLLKGE